MLASLRNFSLAFFAVATEAKSFVLIFVVTAKLPYCGAFFLAAPRLALY